MEKGGRINQTQQGCFQKKVTESRGKGKVGVFREGRS